MKNLFSNIKGDAFGGITAGIVALPLALAFGVSSGLGPSAGLYGAIFLSFFAALFGGTNTQISGPTAPLTAVSMVLISGLLAINEGNLEKALPIILAVFILAGLMQVMMGLLGFGKYIKYIPYPVVSGFMTAIGLIILITQILPAVGYYPGEDEVLIDSFKPQAEEIILHDILKEEADEGILVLEDFRVTMDRAELITDEDIYNESKSLASNSAKTALGSVQAIPRAFHYINWLELLLALGTIFIIYGFKRITQVVPSTLVALLIMSGIAVGFGLDYRPIEEIPGGFPLPNLEVFTELSFAGITPYFFTALTLALLGSIDSLLTSVVADNVTKTRHDPKKELIGQGIGNSIAGLFGGLPGAGATIRTVVNINAGGKTKLSGMISGVMLLIVLLAIGPIASKIPAAVLAGILITVGIGVMDYKGLKAARKMPKDLSFGPIKLSSEVIIMVIVLLLSTFWNLVYAVGIGLILGALLFMKKVGDITAKRSDVKPLSQEKAWHDATDFPEELKEIVYVNHLKGPLFFGSTSDFQLLASEIPDSASIVVIRVERMDYMDQSGLYTMEDIIIDLTKKKIMVLLVDLLEQPRFMMERIDIIPNLVPEDHIFDNFGACTQWIKENIKA
ncbi:MAG: SulP family inorganic anion transporter [Flavobacteriaceae bacterium]|nr:SulP family inorganic anion transporter [Flavobacteriaceae bacterium]